MEFQKGIDYYVVEIKLTKNNSLHRAIAHYVGNYHGEDYVEFITHEEVKQYQVNKLSHFKIISAIEDMKRI